MNQAINELRSSLDLAIGVPLLPEPVDTGVIGDETLRSVIVAIPDDRGNSIDKEEDKTKPLTDANRVELLNQASSLISEISRDNMRLRQEIGELIAGRHTSGS